MAPDIHTTKEPEDKKVYWMTKRRDEGRYLFYSCVLELCEPFQTIEIDIMVKSRPNEKIAVTSEDSNHQYDIPKLHADDQLSKIQETYKKLLQEFLEMNERELDEWTSVLLKDASYRTDAIVESFQVVVDETIEGGKGVTWSRIIGIYAFAGKICQNYCKKTIPKVSETVKFRDLVDSLSTKVLCEDIINFVHDQGGWGEIGKVLPPRRTSGLNEHSFSWLLAASVHIFKEISTFAIGTIIGRRSTFTSSLK